MAAYQPHYPYYVQTQYGPYLVSGWSPYVQQPRSSGQRGEMQPTSSTQYAYPHVTQQGVAYGIPTVQTTVQKPSPALLKQLNHQIMQRQMFQQALAKSPSSQMPLAQMPSRSRSSSASNSHSSLSSTKSPSPAPPSPEESCAAYERKLKALQTKNNPRGPYSTIQEEIEKIKNDEDIEIQDDDESSIIRCRQCNRSNTTMHLRLPLCLACIKHNHASVDTFRKAHPGLEPEEHIELFVLASLSRFAKQIRFRCDCEGGCVLSCNCEFDMSKNRCVPCRFLKGVYYMCKFQNWPQKRQYKDPSRRKGKRKGEISAVDKRRKTSS